MSIRVITARNVNHALREGLQWLRLTGTREDTRGGECLVAPGPVITEYTHPQERVLFDPTRDANPVFHLMESLWMLAGLREVEHLVAYNQRMKTYAEDNGEIHGAYGYRWRYGFGPDQIKCTIVLLRHQPNTRQAVIAMWDPLADMAMDKRDVPCNTHLYFDLRGGKLNMTVCCRSNDALWGAYGANVVHMSILQEVIAHGVGVPMGRYRQMSNNFHVYTELPMVEALLQESPIPVDDPYTTERAYPVPLLQDHETVQDLLDDCEAFFLRPYEEAQTAFMWNVAVPLREAYLARKAGEPFLEHLSDAWECDWLVAFRQWADRRK